MEVCRREVLIESPFVAEKRIRTMSRTLSNLVTKGVRVTIHTRHPNDLDVDRRLQAWETIFHLDALGAQLHMISGNHHLKLAVIDGKVLWEGSLNILSQSNSREIMRRTQSNAMAGQVLSFLHTRGN
jgi:hypothetical protein